MGGYGKFAWIHKLFTPFKAYNWLIGRESSNPSLIDKDGVMVWHLKIPLKIKIFLLLSRRNGLITGDLRHTRLGVPSQNCPLCNFPTDSALHIFSTCLVIDQIWRAIFDEALPSWEDLWTCFRNSSKPCPLMVGAL
jgi:hypothetical protein